MASSWKLTKKLKETTFMRSHAPSSSSQSSTPNSISQHSTSASSESTANNSSASPSTNGGRPSSRDTLVASGPSSALESRSNTIIANDANSESSSRSTVTTTASNSSSTTAGVREATRSQSANPGLLRVKIYELKHLAIGRQYKSALPSWAFDKSSTKPPPICLVLEYDKTQILLHAIGGTVEEPVWDKTTAFDVAALASDVPLSIKCYLRTCEVVAKKEGVSHEAGKNSSSSSAAAAAAVSAASQSTAASRTHGTGEIRSGAAAGVGQRGKEDSGWRYKDVCVGSAVIPPKGFNKQDTVPISGGLLSIKCELHSTRNKQLSIDDFALLKVVGKGSFGKVMQVRKSDTQQIYALKTIRKAHIVSKSEVGHTLAERTVLAKINNPFIVPLKFSFQSPEKLYLVLAFVNGGELFHHLQREGRFDLNRARFYTAELLCALECLHEYNVIYRDLKPENILLDYTGHIALCDFGLCKLNMGSKDSTSTFCGTPEYLAPELLLGQGYTKAVDWWTLGVLFYEMLTGLPPFYDQNTNTMYHKIVKDPLTFPADMDREAKSLISGLLDRDPQHRLGSRGAAEIKGHPFFHQIDWKYLLNKKYAAPFLPSVASAVDTSNFDSEFTSELPMDSVVDKEFYLSDSVQKQFGGWSYSNESKLASSGKW